MKTILLTGLLWFASISSGYMQTQADQSDAHSVVKFKEVSHDFGLVPYGSDVSYTFMFKNISKYKICIRDVQTSCGCTTPKFSTDPIKPGRKGSVSAKYDSSRPGKFSKTVTAMISDGEQVVLTLSGEIGPKPDGKSAPAGTKE